MSETELVVPVDMKQNPDSYPCYYISECQKVRNQIDLKRIRFILEVSRAESITTAAETLGFTQSALSRSIAEVEEALGTALFLHLPRGIRLAAAGERFVSGAKRVLGDIDTLLAQVKESSTLVGGRLRIGVAPTGYVNHAAKALVMFARELPNVDVEIVTGSTQQLCPSLLNGEFDLMLGSSSYLRRWRELELSPITPMHFACLKRQQHPLMLGDQTPREIDVLRYPWILPGSVEPIYSDMAHRFTHHGLPPFQPRYVADNFYVIRPILRASNAVYPLHHPDPGFSPLDQKFGLLTGVVRLPDHVMSLAYSTSRPKSAAARRFETLMFESLRKSSASLAGTVSRAGAISRADPDAAGARTGLGERVL